jgi:tetratricopeptide (TPR) repeat protein
VSLWLLGGFLLAARPAWGQIEDEGPSILDELRRWLAETQTMLGDPTIRTYLVYATGAIILLWLASRAVRLLRHGGGNRGVAAPSRSENLREARRAARRGDHVQAGRFYEAAEAWEAAAGAYEKGRAFAEAASVWERLNQGVKAARLYEQANESPKAAELYARLGNYARAASLFQKGGHDVRAAEAYERAGEVDRAAELYAKNEVFDRAGELLLKLGQPARAAEFFERALRRLVVRGAELAPETIRARQGLARRCGELYAQGGQPAKAAAVLRAHGLEVEAAEYYCQAGDWETGLDLFLRHRQFDRAIATCRAQGAEDRLHIVQGERMVADGRERDAARQFEAAGAWWRAAEMYERVADHAKAALMYAQHGDDERAAEMHIAAGEPALAAAALERLGKPKEAARYYQQAGALREAARALQSAGDFFGAGRLLLEARAVEEAVPLLQQVGPESERYLDATVMLGDLFLQRELYGLAKEKFEKAATLKPIAPDFIHPTYQLATIQERQGDLKSALSLFEKVMAEQLSYQDVQARVASLRERLARAPQTPPAGDATQVVSASPRRYRVIKELGRGGMGIVYLAEDTILQRPVAYKVVPDAIREDPKSLEYFLREARIAASLQHQNIVTIYDAAHSADEVYIAMEYVEGRSLQQILDETPALPLARGLGIFRQACLGLAHAHRNNVVHRDIKPANMMITPAGVVKLMDFGLAAVVTEVMAKVTSVRGTPFYMAPEQILGEEISALSDQYSLGCTLYHMVTGRPPFVEGDILYHHIHTSPTAPRERSPQIPVWLDAIILKTMMKDQAMRFPSVAVLLQELDRCLAGNRGGGPPSGHGVR